MAITAELIKNSTGEYQSRHDLWLMVKVEPIANHFTHFIESSYAATITFRDPFTYKDISRTKYVCEVPTDRDYAHMIVHALHFEHPEFDFTWGYDYIDNRITIKYKEREVEKKPLQELLKEKKDENKHMEHYELTLVKLVTNGPATIGWFMTPYKRGIMKVVVKRAEGEYDDPEKAILALYMKALSGGHTPFHSRMNKAMKMMYAAIDKEREIEEARLAREEKKSPTLARAVEDAVEQFKTAFNAVLVKEPEIDETVEKVVDEIRESKSQELASNINNSLNRLSSYVNRLKDTAKKIELNSVYGANNAKVEKNGTPWTWDEVSFLHRHYDSKSTKSIAMALGRSECAVRSKAKRLSIKKGGNTHG